MMPFAVMKTLGLIADMPGAFIAAASASTVVVFLLLISGRYEHTVERRVLDARSGYLFGTWTWTNLTFAGAWQLALGFAMLGELGAIYLPSTTGGPFLAGAFLRWRLATRTEYLLTAADISVTCFTVELQDRRRASGPPLPFRFEIGDSRILSCPVTARAWRRLSYNYVRFHSFTDFGYARIPGVLTSHGTRTGYFRLNYIPRQAWEMLMKPWEWRPQFPYLVPNGFSSSILISSPFLLLSFSVRERVTRAEIRRVGCGCGPDVHCCGCTETRADGNSDIGTRWFCCLGCLSFA